MINLKNKKILVTGGRGFLGKHVVSALQKHGVLNKNLYVPSSKQCDLRKVSDCEATVKNKDVVIHLAANIGGIGYNKNYPGTLFYENTIMGIQLMEAARLAGVKKFVTIGTVCEYPKNTAVPFNEESLWHGYPDETTAPYGLAKKALLVQGQAYRAQYNFNSIHVLPVNLYGPYDHFEDFGKEKSHVIPALIKKVLDAKQHKDDHVIVWGSGRATREFIYVEDAAKGIIFATINYNKPEPVNIGTGKETKIKDVVKLISKIIGYQGVIVWDKTKPDGQPRRALDVSKAKKEFNFTAKTDLKTGLGKTINWYLKQMES